MSEFTVAFSHDYSFTRTNIILDPMFSYRNMSTLGTPYTVDSVYASGWDSSRSKFGDWSFRVEPRTGSSWVEILQYAPGLDFYPTTEAVSHTISCWVLADDDCNMDFFQEYWSSISGGTYKGDDQSSTFAIPGGVWTQISFTFTPPAGSNYVDFYVDKQASATAIGFNIDGLLYERTRAAFPYGPKGSPHPVFDGDTTPIYPPQNETVSVEWDGTPGASSSTMSYSSSEFTGDLLSLNINQGRRRVDEFTTPGTCELELLNPTTIPEVGCLVEVAYGSETLFTGTVSDTEMIFSMTDNTDVLRVSCESYMAQAGRAEVTLAGTAGSTVVSAFEDACDAASLYSNVSGMAGYTVAFDDYQGNCLSHLQRIQTTTVGAMHDASDYTVEMVSGEQTFYSQIGGGFTDVLPTTDGILYSGIRFGSVADHFVTLVRLEPDRTGVDPVQTGSPPHSLVLTTYSPSTDSAEGLAVTYLQSFVSTDYSPHEITVDVAAQTNTKWAESLDLFQNAGFVHRRQALAFRGTTYQTIMQGFTLTATPDSARVTYYLEPVSAYPYFRLDDSDVGILSENVLGGGN